MEWHRLRCGVFDLCVAKPRQAADEPQDIVDRSVGSGNRAVDPFAGEQKDSLHTLGAAQPSQFAAHRFAVVQPGELVERSNADGGRRTGQGINSFSAASWRWSP